jgi:hypothetical protein
LSTKYTAQPIHPDGTNHHLAPSHAPSGVTSIGCPTSSATRATASTQVIGRTDGSSARQIAIEQRFMLALPVVEVLAAVLADSISVDRVLLGPAPFAKPIFGGCHVSDVRAFWAACLAERCREVTLRVTLPGALAESPAMDCVYYVAARPEAPPLCRAAANGAMSGFSV